VDIYSFLKSYWYLLVVFVVAFVTVVVVLFVVLFRLKRIVSKDIESRNMDEIDKALVEKAKIKPSEIKMSNVLGVGSFATVYRGYWQRNEVAIKVIKSTKATALIDEAGIMVKIRHPNVVTFLGACLNKPELFIVTEFMSRGDLYNILHNNDIVIENAHVRNMALDTCKGMAYLHSRSIIHRDLKTFNLLVDKDWTVKVGDFGLSRILEEVQSPQTLTSCGTTSWAAPEVLRDQRYSLNADVYSFGICLWEMCTRKEPYGPLFAPQVVIAVAVNGKRPEIPSDLPDYFASLIKLCWTEVPTERPSFVMIMEQLESISCPVPSTLTPYSIKEKTKKRKARKQTEEVHNQDSILIQ